MESRHWYPERLFIGRRWLRIEFAEGAGPRKAGVTWYTSGLDKKDAAKRLALTR